VLTGTDTPVAIGKPHQARLRADAARHFPELEGLPARALPNGKLSMEVPTSLLTGVQTASQAEIGTLVFLDRHTEGPARTETMSVGEVAALLLRDLPSYGPEVNAVHERTVGILAALPAFRLTYSSLLDAIRILT
jgi:hypothetical protein